VTFALFLLLLPTSGAAAAPEPEFTDPVVVVDPERAQRRRVGSQLSVFDDEPAVQQVHAWAAREADSDPAELARQLQESRAEGALPLIRLRGRYTDRSNRKWDSTDVIAGRDRDSDYQVDLWLEWDLGRLAAGDTQTRLLRESRARAELRQAVLAQVDRVYFDRRRALLERALAAPDEPLAARLERRLRVQELNATLDALTGGKWSRALVRAPPSMPEQPSPIASEEPP